MGRQQARERLVDPLSAERLIEHETLRHALTPGFRDLGRRTARAARGGRSLRSRADQAHVNEAAAFRLRGSSLNERGAPVPSPYHSGLSRCALPRIRMSMIARS